MTNRERLRVWLAVDLAILTVRQDLLNVLVIERDNEPYQGQTALPGGFIRDGEDLREAAVRELAEETGLDGNALHLEQVRAYGAPGRDPRGRVISVAYLAIAPDLPVPTSGSDARSAHWTPITEVLGDLAFDHGQILNDAVERARTRLEFTTLATASAVPRSPSATCPLPGPMTDPDRHPHRSGSSRRTGADTTRCPWPPPVPAAGAAC